MLISESALFSVFLVPQSQSDKGRVPRLTPVPAADTYSIIGTHRFASKVIVTFLFSFMCLFFPSHMLLSILSDGFFYLS